MFLLLAACTTWIDQKPACKYDVYEWSDDLTAHILTGPGDGSFDYDPADTPRKRISGDYKFGNGQFAWEVAWADAYWVLAESVEGQGTAFHNGNLDVEFVQSTTDILDDTVNTGWRVFRQGCSMRIQTWDADYANPELFDRVGVYQDDDSFKWEAEDEAYLYEGVMRRNLSYTYNQDSRDGSYHDSFAVAPDGSAEGVWTGPFFEEDCIGESEYLRKFNGGGEERTVVTCGGSEAVVISEEYNYDGSGTAHYEFSDGTTCDAVADGTGSCRYECSDGEQGRC